jgi:hypothetical protein
MVIVAAAGLATTSCRGAEAPRGPDSVTTPPPSQSERQKARDFLRIVSAYEDLVGSAVDETAGEIDAASCGVIPPHPGLNIEVGEFELEEAVRLLVTEKRLVADYAGMAQQLVALRPRARPLRTLAKDAKMTAAEAKKIERLTVDLCAAIRRWRARGWHKDFSAHFYERAVRSVGVDYDEMKRSFERDANTLPALQKLGLTFNQALRLAGGVNFFV